ncbi:MAG TPA: hypothetical protein DCS93_41595 [Microscillaceae bacterium]|nr:hypothetical protein [Microscillaceae bacterium]
MDKNIINQTINDLQQRLDSLQSDLQNLKNQVNEAPPADRKVFVLVDAGHGGNHPDTGAYMTPPHIGKKYIFTDNSGKAILEIREGEVNRIIANKFCEMLASAGFGYKKIYHEYLDNSLDDRVRAANATFDQLTPQGKKVILLSFHSNAIGMNQSGKGEAPNFWSVWTTKGSTTSDKIADAWYLKTKEIVGSKIRIEQQASDGDFDYEANFKIIYQTKMPAALVENLFFTNLANARLLLDNEYQTQSAQAAFETVKWCEDNL